MPSLSERIDDLNARVTGLEVAVQETYPAKMAVLTARITRVEQRMEKMQPVSIAKIERWLTEIDRAMERVEKAVQVVERLARSR